MKIIGAFDRNQAKNLVPRPHSAIISIANMDSKHPKLNQKWSAILRLKFDDVLDSRDGCGMTETDAIRILSFVVDNIEKDFFVHCDAGISRSPAIVVALEEIFNSTDVTDKYPHYNKFVKNKIKDAWFKSLWK